MGLKGLSGKTAIVTGGGGGIGSATTRRLIEEGCKVAVVDINEDVIKRAFPAPNKDTLLAIGADVSTEQGCAHYVKATVERFGGVDLFFNNAGIMGQRELLVDMKAEDFDRVMSINLRGVFLGLREVMRQMIAQKRGGAIVNTASAGALRPNMKSAAYGVSKRGVIGLTQVAALENGVNNIRVNAICPGATDTPLIAPTPGADWKGATAKLPIARVANPSEMADLVAYLLSDEASYQTGGVYVADGGLMLT